MALVQWLKDNPIMSQYIVGARDDGEMLQLENTIKPKKPECSCVWGDVMYGGRCRTDDTDCPKHDRRSRRPRTQGEAIERAPDLRVAYAPAKLAELPYGR